MIRLPNDQTRVSLSDHLVENLGGKHEACSETRIFASMGARERLYFFFDVNHGYMKLVIPSRARVEACSNKTRYELKPVVTQRNRT